MGLCQALNRLSSDQSINQSMPTADPPMSPCQLVAQQKMMCSSFCDLGRPGPDFGFAPKGKGSNDKELQSAACKRVATSDTVLASFSQHWSRACSRSSFPTIQASLKSCADLLHRHPHTLRLCRTLACTLLVYWKSLQISRCSRGCSTHQLQAEASAGTLLTARNAGTIPMLFPKAQAAMGMVSGLVWLKLTGGLPPSHPARPHLHHKSVLMRQMSLTTVTAADVQARCLQELGARPPSGS